MSGLLTLMLAGALFGAPKQQPPAYVVPIPAAATWRVLVFAAYVPEAARGQKVPYTISVAMTVQGSPKQTELKGEVGWLATAAHDLAVPAGGERVELVLRWPVERRSCDLDLGVEGRDGFRLAPLFTTCYPERLVYDSGTATFYQNLSRAWPEWPTGYPFWAEVRATRPPGRAAAP